MEIEPKEVNASDERLFDLHKLRFDDNAPKELSNMVAYEANTPCLGFTLRVYAGEEHIATSFFHVGHLAADSSYCVYDPSDRWARYSLGHLTMLVEILYCIELGLEFYYVGYRYNVPSHFDYKANFFGLQRYKSFKKWVPCPRIPPKPFHKTSQQQTDEL
jgi:arginine-tRNA-protein transferase